MIARIGILLLVLGSFLATAVSRAQTPVTNMMPLDRVTADDGSLDLSAFTGRVVYLDFWASWCRPCRGSFEWMERMHTAYADRGLVIVAVNVDRDREKAQRFLDRTTPSFAIVLDPEATLARELALEAMPSSFLFGVDGGHQLSHTGFRTSDSDELERAIVSALEAIPAEDQE